MGLGSLRLLFGGILRFMHGNPNPGTAGGPVPAAALCGPGSLQMERARE